jgi:predicted membrane channel-forming protein YqfA (hemolysin III family)
MDLLPMNDQPTWRKPAGMGLILLLILVWAVLIASLSSYIGQLHWTLQALFYLVAGTAWVLPLKPLIRWMELGSFREGADRR